MINKSKKVCNFLPNNADTYFLAHFTAGLTEMFLNNGSTMIMKYLLVIFSNLSEFFTVAD